MSQPISTFEKSPEETFIWLKQAGFDEAAAQEYSDWFPKK